MSACADWGLNSQSAWRLTCGTILILMLLTGLARAEDPALLKSLGVDPASNTAVAVIVGKTTLAHTTQLYPIGKGGELPAGAAAQTDLLLDNLQKVLQAGESDLGRVVRLNVYVTNETVVPEVQARIKERWSQQTVKPAITYAITTLPRIGVLVAADAVAASSSQVKQVVRKRVADVGQGDHAQSSHVTLMPPGRILYISGQAEPGRIIEEATLKTLEGLDRTLKHLGLDRNSIVQAKSFVQPMSEAAKVEAETRRFFALHYLPAVSLVEWMDKKPSIETELVVWAPEDWKPRAEAHVDAPGTAQFVWLDWLKPNSPNFSRLTIVDQSRAIYISGLFGRTADTPDEEVRDTFRQLKDLLKEAGSDYDHLAKATYYPSTEATSTKLNTIRPEFYNGKRPPAASKAPLRGCARPGRHLTLDFIAVGK